MIRMGAVILYISADVPPAALTSIESSLNSIMLIVIRAVTEIV